MQMPNKRNMRLRLMRTKSFIGEYWAEKSVKHAPQKPDFISYEVRSSEFQYKVDQTSKGFSLYRAKTVQPLKHNTNREPYWALEAAYLLTPMISLEYVLNDEDFRMRHLKATQDGQELQLTYIGPDQAGLVTNASFIVKLDRSFRVTRSTMRFDSRGEKLVYELTNEYSGLEETNTIPSKSTFRRAVEGKTGHDLFVLDNKTFGFEKIPLYCHTLRSELFEISGW